MADRSATESRPFALHLRIKVSSGRREEFLAFLRDAIPFYEAPGGIRVLLLERLEDPDEFIEVVEYADQAAYERDQVRVDSDPTMRSRLDQWRALLAAPVEIETYRVVEVVPITSAAPSR